ncbi:hypothetical protein TRFO_06212 [Tritrichomonas foetus]|uniref:Uncharacterized protein n=1 Tax=Tritrichomonas foetus TaxID=1144522 RepID=A0A1J4K024_9EUKA|nr:hypothetical protein TRFO_06212 [Tritrichomonas foetus]|eukprot:OHT04767.1 hypothetical protein TRFO_06212 [Tritrichomonas foetus]
MSFLTQFLGELTTDFVSFFGEDVIFFKCRKIPKTFSMKDFDDFIITTNRSVLFTSFEYQWKDSIIVVGMKPKSFFQESLVAHLLYFLAKKNIYAEVYHSTKSAAEILKMLKLHLPTEDNQQSTDANDNKKDDDFDLFISTFNNPSATPQNIRAEQERFDKEFSYDKFVKNYSWDYPIFEQRIIPTDIEKSLSLFNEVKIVEDLSPYRVFQLQNQKALQELPNISSYTLRDLSEHRSFFETDE